MVHIVNKSESPKVLSPLARADFSRQKDIYRLAKMGEKRSKGMWNDFATECPDQARLAKADCQDDDLITRQVNKKVDKVVKKSKKKKKNASHSATNPFDPLWIANPPPATPMIIPGMIPVGLNPSQIVKSAKAVKSDRRAYLRSLLNSDNPVDREVASKLLGGV